MAQAVSIQQGELPKNERPSKLSAEAPRYSPSHLAGLRRFALAITVLTVVGHAYLGFEQSYAQPLVSLATAYSVQLLLEAVSAWAERRRPRFLGGPVALVNFLLSAHITGLAIAMLLYFHERIWIVAFASAVAICSKTLFRVPVGSSSRHFFNPSNFGISVTLLAFPWVGLFIPWQFTTGLPGFSSWLFVGFVFVLGSFLNIRYTRRFGVVVGFLFGFLIQAIVRSVFFDASLLAILMAVTGIPAMIYVFYMVPDPSTTPDRAVPQFVFGFSVAAVYLIFMLMHIVFGLFFALTIVSALRGLGLLIKALVERRRLASAQAQLVSA